MTTLGGHGRRSGRTAFWTRALRMWNWFFYVVVVLIAASTLLAPGTRTSRAASLVCLALLALAYTLLGRRALASGERVPANVYLLLLVVLTSLQVGWDNLGAILLFVAYTQIWFFAEQRAHGVAWAVALTVGVGIRFGLLAAASHQALLPTVGELAVALIFAVALGLWVTQIAEQSEERRLLIARLEAAQAELAATHHAAGVAAERERMAQEIHDTLAQGFTSVVMLAQTTTAELDRGHDAAARGRVEQIEQVARDNLAEARALVAAFGPADLADATLGEALERLAGRFTSQTGVRVVVADGTLSAASGLGRDVQVVLLRAAQESLANVRKHAGASHVTLGLARDGTSVRLDVADDGRGLPADVVEGQGLRGMRERARTGGGELAVVGAPGAGTHVTLTLPVGRPAGVEVA